MKKLLTISLVLCLCLSLFGCSKPKDDHITPGGPTETFDLPEDTLPFEESQTSVTSSDSPFDTVTLPTEDTEATSETSDEVTEEQEDEPVRELPKEEYPDCRAGDMLRLLNGEKAHAKFTEAVSYDGEHMSTGNLEYYIDGIDMMFIDDYNCIIMDGVTQIVIDFESGIYYVEDYHEADYSIVFGYEPDAYTFISEEETEDAYIEVLSVEQYGHIITSTWTFGADGSVTVKEENEDAGTFTIYSFHEYGDDTEGMNMSLYEEYTESEY